MNENAFFSSLTRISDLQTVPFDTAPVPRSSWEPGDYAVARVASIPRGFCRVELTNGRMAEVAQGDLIVGAFGVRHATLEAVGSWRDVRDDGRMHLLTSAGLLGRVTSLSASLPSLLSTSYEGSVFRKGEKLRMGDFVTEPAWEFPYSCPTIVIVGTSMSAGKTTSAKVVIRQLKRMGLRVVGTKLSGAGRYRDVLAMGDAGADRILDFVDVGLPSSIYPPEEFRPHLRKLLAKISAERPDVVVAEAGASPLEPYNGKVVVEELGESVCCSLLCASDPYAVVGVMQGFDFRPDLVAGLATSTSAGVELVQKLTGIEALNLLDPRAQPALRAILQRTLAFV